ncbi:MAG: Nif11-like leader peptide family natural product precursor [Chlorobiaceae bacterium]|nr:Nif11-like leader peptide family natural product precursor [Chlorobiaceae bacterium]NMW21639.1 Nif11-like leader peptide family natural product precursor [Chlorobiaceae bacterium]
MSQEQANAFLERMKSDELFRDAVIRMEDIETKMAYISRQGFSFTADELEMANCQITPLN